MEVGHGVSLVKQAPPNSHTPLPVRFVVNLVPAAIEWCTDKRYYPEQRPDDKESLMHSQIMA